MKYTDITSHEIACKVLGKDPSLSTTTDQMITDIFDAVNKINGNFKADFTNNNQYKWRPVFVIDSSALRFNYSAYIYSCSLTGVGSRLCHYVSSREEADHIGETFIELFKQHYYGR